MNVIIMGWVNLAMASILKIIFGISDDNVLLYHHRRHGNYRGLFRDIGPVGRRVHRHVPVHHRHGGVHRSCGRDPRSAGDRRHAGAHGPSCRNMFSIFSPGVSMQRLHGGDGSHDPFRLGVHRPYRRAVVVVLVPRERAGRRGIHRPADDVGQGRAPFTPGDPLVRHRSLRAAALALDHRRPGVARALPRPGISPRGIYSRHAGPSPRGAQGLSRGRVPGRLHVNHSDAPELGELVYHQRPVPAFH